MEAVLPVDEVRWYFQKIIGYAALGLTVEQIFIMLQGKGGDGKSTTMDVIRIVLGLYAVVGNVKTFLAGTLKDAGAATPELVRFVGDTRLISVGEPKRGQALAEEMVKAFTGGSALPARANYGDEFEFEPRGKVIMEVNSRPRISGDDDGIWGRIVIILFPRQFRRRDGWVKAMKANLLANREGVFRWIVEGALGYLKEGLEPPAEVAAAIEEYRRSANPFSEWMAARVDISDPLALTGSTAMYNDYKTWCEAEGVSDREMMTSSAFGRALGDRQILLGPKDSKGLKRRRGAKLRPVGELFVGDDEPAEADDRVQPRPSSPSPPPRRRSRNSAMNGQLTDTSAKPSVLFGGGRCRGAGGAG
jgi:putative DNA primase/helicase